MKIRRWQETAVAVAFASMLAQACSSGGGSPGAMTAGIDNAGSDASSSDDASQATEAGDNEPDASSVDDDANAAAPPMPRDAGRPDASRDAGRADAATSVGDAGNLDSLRQACVDHINMYRATLNLAPLARANPTQEACSDKGAMEDGTSNMAHGSAGMCPGFGGQDTCPELPVGGFAMSTLQSSLIQCLDQMWAEGPPPSGTSVQQCIQDYTGCFLMHGHWINMSMASYKTVSCGFYEVSSTDWWGNQDFAN